jgi:LmbE family N-acetylglucosaminyl deacetylase
VTRQVLVIAAHPDDEVLGLGGTIARHVSSGDQVTIALIADVGTARYEEATIQALRRCALQAASQLGVSDVRFAGLADQKLDTLPILEITQWIEGVMQDVQPRIIYTHHRGDINCDHRVVHEATLTAARPYSAPYVERILCYETPSATEWAGPYLENCLMPNVYVDITDYIESKLSAISAYTTELCPFPHPRSAEALRARATYWGSVMGVAAAEPFMLAREIQR